ncbi:unnamed protein product, partial [Soboliphyme baturini]|uniref:PDZ domain-containing protein n=1 Tax=Soboliphyme baturini TaxID=241478 RepID=A0A183IQB9_9BILA
MAVNREWESFSDADSGISPDGESEGQVSTCADSFGCQTASASATTIVLKSAVGRKQNNWIYRRNSYATAVDKEGVQSGTHDDRSTGRSAADAGQRRERAVPQNMTKESQAARQPLPSYESALRALGVHDHDNWLPKRQKGPPSITTFDGRSADSIGTSLTTFSSILSVEKLFKNEDDDTVYAKPCKLKNDAQELSLIGDFTNVRQYRTCVKGRVVGLGSDGSYTVELRRYGNEPFGFYISSATYKRRKGFHIADVCEQNLRVLLRKGDKLLEVNSVSVKGKKLQEVEQLLASRERVMIRILPMH